MPKVDNARSRMLSKLKALGDQLGTMGDSGWGKFLNTLPRDEFIALIAWHEEQMQEEKAALETATVAPRIQ